MLGGLIASVNSDLYVLKLKGRQVPPPPLNEALAVFKWGARVQGGKMTPLYTLLTPAFSHDTQTMFKGKVIEIHFHVEPAF